jgi:hypothetical protein
MIAHLMRMGIPRIETAAILAMGSIAGQQAPPVNVPIMIICTSVFMPYEGFTVPLALLNFTLGVFSILVIGRQHISVERLKEIAAEPVEADLPPPSLKLYSPMLLLVALLSGPRLVPGWPDMTTPLPFLIVSLASLFTGRPLNFFRCSKKTFDATDDRPVHGIGSDSVHGATGSGSYRFDDDHLPRVVLFWLHLVGLSPESGDLRAAALGPHHFPCRTELDILCPRGADQVSVAWCRRRDGGLFAMRVGERYWPIFKKCSSRRFA